MSMRKRRMALNADTKESRKKNLKFFSGPIVFAALLSVIILGSIELIATIRSYALSLAEFHALQHEKTLLDAHRNNLINNINRWNDKAYVATRARYRLGFVFPGEQAVRVEHPEAVTGKVLNEFADSNSNSKLHTQLPWYSDLSYALHKADKPDNLTIQSYDKTIDTTVTRTND